MALLLLPAWWLISCWPHQGRWPLQMSQSKSRKHCSCGRQGQGQAALPGSIFLSSSMSQHKTAVGLIVMASVAFLSNNLPPNISIYVSDESDGERMRYSLLVTDTVIGTGWSLQHDRPSICLPVQWSLYSDPLIIKIAVTFLSYKTLTSTYTTVQVFMPQYNPEHTVIDYFVRISLSHTVTHTDTLNTDLSLSPPPTHTFACGEKIHVCPVHLPTQSPLPQI